MQTFSGSTRSSHLLRVILFSLMSALIPLTFCKHQEANKHIFASSVVGKDSFTYLAFSCSGDLSLVTESTEAQSVGGLFECMGRVPRDAALQGSLPLTSRGFSLWLFTSTLVPKRWRNGSGDQQRSRRACTLVGRS